MKAIGVGRFLGDAVARQSDRRDLSRGSQRRRLPAANANDLVSNVHGVLISQRCLSLLGSNFDSVAKLLPTAEERDCLV